MLRFTGVFSWDEKTNSCTCKEARAQWYKDFAEGMEIYERLGQFIDALSLLTVPGGVKSKFVENVQRIGERWDVYGSPN